VSTGQVYIHLVCVFVQPMIFGFKRSL